MKQRPCDNRPDLLSYGVQPPKQSIAADWWPGVVLGLVLVMVIFLADPILKRFDHDSVAKSPSCITNLKQLSTALLIYAQDHSGKLPPADSWATAIFPYTRNPDVFRCSKRRRQKYAYAFNSRLGGMKLDSIRAQDKVVMLFETTQDRKNAADPVVSVDAPHDGRGNVAFADGHVKAVRTAR